MHIHFIGIGGVSTSALAKYLKAKSFFVTGSDKNRSYITNELQRLDIPIFYDHKEENCLGADIVIYNSAIKGDNPELIFALKNKIPCLERADLLRYISKKFATVIGVSGCHGKTTVTSMIAHILSQANLPFTAHVGGFDKDFGNFYQCGNDIFLSEVCEFNKNIDKFDATLAIALNIDNDHLTSYENFQDIKNTFYRYLDRAKFAIINSDDENLRRYTDKCLTFGLKSGDYHCDNLTFENNSTRFSVYEKEQFLYEYKTNLIGKYQVANVLAATATARRLGIDGNVICKGLQSFGGVKRRNEFLCKLNGADIFADYAHHPTEIKAFLDYVNCKKYKKVHLVFQPHTYSRTKNLQNQFIEVLKEVDNLYLYKTYAAREEYDHDGSALKLSQNLPKSQYFDEFTELINKLCQSVNVDEAVLIVGAGDLYDEFVNYKNKL